MLSAKDQRFLSWWDEQRRGGGVPYVLLYSLVWTIIVFLSAIFFPLVLSFIIDIRYPFGYGTTLFWVLLLISFIAGLALSLYHWHRNEKKRKWLNSFSGN